MTKPASQGTRPLPAWPGSEMPEVFATGDGNSWRLSIRGDRGQQIDMTRDQMVYVVDRILDLTMAAAAADLEDDNG